MGRHPLGRDVVLVEPPSGLAHVERVDRLARREPLARGPDLDDEATARLQVRRGVAEARDLRRLRRQVADRVEDQVHQGERPSTVVVAMSPIVTPMSSASSFSRSLRDHRLRHVDPVHLHAAPRERERDPARPDLELECGAHLRPAPRGSRSPGRGSRRTPRGLVVLAATRSSKYPSSPCTDGIYRARRRASYGVSRSGRSGMGDRPGEAPIGRERRRQHPLDHDAGASRSSHETIMSRLSRPLPRVSVPYVDPAAASVARHRAPRRTNSTAATTEAIQSTPAVSLKMAPPPSRRSARHP